MSTTADQAIEFIRKKRRDYYKLWKSRNIDRHRAYKKLWMRNKRLGLPTVGIFLKKPRESIGISEVLLKKRYFTNRARQLLRLGASTETVSEECMLKTDEVRLMKSELKIT